MTRRRPPPRKGHGPGGQSGAARETGQPGSRRSQPSTKRPWPNEWTDGFQTDGKPCARELLDHRLQEAIDGAISTIRACAVLASGGMQDELARRLQALADEIDILESGGDRRLTQAISEALHAVDEWHRSMRRKRQAGAS